MKQKHHKKSFDYDDYDDDYTDDYKYDSNQLKKLKLEQRRQAKRSINSFKESRNSKEDDWFYG